jgi:hypothetical protein
MLRDQKGFENADKHHGLSNEKLISLKSEKHKQTKKRKKERKKEKHT